MKQKRHSVDQIVSKLRKADVELGKGKKVPEVCKELEVTEQTYYRWRQKYGGMQPVMVKQLKSLEKENSRLKKLVADQALDMEIPSGQSYSGASSELLVCRHCEDDRSFAAGADHDRR